MRLVWNETKEFTGQVKAFIDRWWRIVWRIKRFQIFIYLISLLHFPPHMITSVFHMLMCIFRTSVWLALQFNYYLFHSVCDCWPSLFRLAHFVHSFPFTYFYCFDANNNEFFKINRYIVVPFLQHTLHSTVTRTAYIQCDIRCSTWNFYSITIMKMDIKSRCSCSSTYISSMLCHCIQSLHSRSTTAQNELYL